MRTTGSREMCRGWYFQMANITSGVHSLEERASSRQAIALLWLWWMERNNAIELVGFQFTLNSSMQI
jgi:hypothetical protein